MNNTLPINLNLNNSFMKDRKSLNLGKTSNFKEKMNQYTLKEKDINSSSRVNMDKNTRKPFEHSKQKDKLEKNKEIIEKEAAKDNKIEDDKVEESKEVDSNEETASDSKIKKEDTSLKDEPVEKEETRDETKEVLEEVIAFLQNPSMQDIKEPKVKEIKEALEKISADLSNNNLNMKELENVLKTIKEADFIPDNIKDKMLNQFKMEMKKAIENTTSLENEDVQSKDLPKVNEDNLKMIKENKKEIKEQAKIEYADKKEEAVEKMALKEDAKENPLPYKDEELDKFEKDFFKVSEKNTQEDNNINFENLNVNKITQKVKTTITPSKDITNINPKDLIDQITKKSKLTINKDNTVMEMKLEPESLGKLTLKVALERGILTAKFTAENDKVKEIIENNLEELRNNLVAQGLNIESLSVSVDSQGDLDRHKNILEAMAYSKKMSKNVGFAETIEDIEETKNPYLSIEESINQLG